MGAEVPFRDLTFADAAGLWIELKSASVCRRTAAGYPGYRKRLSAYFAKTKLHEIGIEQIREYQASESAVMAASTENHQITFLSHILDEAGIWETIQPHYHPLRANPRQRPVLTEEEELRLFQTAVDNPYWRIAYLASLVVAATTLRPNQVRQLRLGDIDLPNNRLVIRMEGTLTPVPLNDTAAWAIQELMERAEQLGAGLPENYLIPHRARSGGAPIVTEPQGSWKRAWRRMCEAANLPDLQMFDLTHSSIVRILAERGLPHSAHKKIAASVKRNIALKSLDPEIADGIHPLNRPKRATVVLTCSRCRREGRTGDRFCGQCGAALSARLKCGYCGTVTKTVAGFCPACSRWLSSRGAESSALVNIKE